MGIFYLLLGDLEFSFSWLKQSWIILRCWQPRSLHEYNSLAEAAIIEKSLVNMNINTNFCIERVNFWGAS